MSSRAAPAVIQVSKVSQVAGHQVLKTIATGNNHFCQCPADAIFEYGGYYWISSYNSVYRYGEKDDQWSVYYGVDKRSLNIVDNFSEGPDKKLWAHFGMGDGPEMLKYFDDDQWHDGTELSGLKSRSRAQAMFLGRDGKLWVAFKDGLFTYDGRGWLDFGSRSEAIKEKYAHLGRTRLQRARIKERFHDDISTARILSGLQDCRGNIWLGLPHALLSFEGKQQQWSIFPLPDNLIGASRLYEDRKGRLWVADYSGSVAVYDINEDRWFVYRLLVGPLSEGTEALPDFFPIRSIYQDRSGRMMFATQIGLFVYTEESNKFEIYTSENSGLPNDIILSIMEDSKRRMWIGTMRGVIILAP